MTTKKRPFVLTTRNMTLGIPIFLLIMLPLILLRQFIPPGTNMTVLTLIWAVIVYFKCPEIFWWLGRHIPPFRRYLTWTQKGRS